MFRDGYVAFYGELEVQKEIRRSSRDTIGYGLRLNLPM